MLNQVMGNLEHEVGTCCRCSKNKERNVLYETFVLDTLGKKGSKCEYAGKSVSNVVRILSIGDRTISFH